MVATDAANLFGVPLTTFKRKFKESGRGLRPGTKMEKDESQTSILHMTMNGSLKHLRDNWALVVFLISLVIYATLMWAHSQEDFVARREFEDHKVLEKQARETHDQLHSTHLHYIREQLREINRKIE